MDESCRDNEDGTYESNEHWQSQASQYYGQPYGYYDQPDLSEPDVTTIIEGNDNQSDTEKWGGIMSRLGIAKSVADLTRSDITGCKFDTVEDVESFFYLYGRLTGFSIRKGHLRKCQNGEIMLRQWLCSKEGRREGKYLKKVDRKREPRAITRVDCKVEFRVVKNINSSKWQVKEFRTEHSHPLAIKSHVQFLRSNRVVSGGDLSLAKSMKSAGIRTCHIMSYLAQEAGGYDKVKFVSKDLYNRLGTGISVELSEADASRAIGYLEHKADHDPGFFGKFSYDEDRRLENVVWADSRCQFDYASFGHALAFDTTYRTNAYGKPLLIWVGINHHFKSTVFGFAILHNETKETYRWVTNTFLECMNGVKPKTVVTDGDLAIRAAVAELMPNSMHRLCSWHIINNAETNVKDPGFVCKLKKLMFRYYTEEAFEIEWDELVKEFGLQKKEWVKALYDRRHNWAETHLRGYFFGGMTTNQRCEGMNSSIKKKVNEKMKMYEFIRAIDLALSRLRHDEMKDDFDTLYSKPVLGSTNMKEIESQAASIYTRAMFFRVRKQMKKEGKYIVTSSSDSGCRITCYMEKYGRTSTHRRVIYDKSNNQYCCDCNYFPSFGIPCRHIFATLKYLHITSFPDTLIHAQWTMTVKKGQCSDDHHLNTPKCRYTCSEEKARFGHMTKRATDVSYLASKSQPLFQLGDEQMSKVYDLLYKKYLEDAPLSNGVDTKSFDGHGIRNPLVTKTKGTSKPKGATGRTQRKCSYCKKRGHNKTTCVRRRRNGHSHSDTHESIDEDKVGDISLGDDNDFTDLSGDSRSVLHDSYTVPGSSMLSNNKRLKEDDNSNFDWWGTPYGS